MIFRGKKQRCFLIPFALCEFQAEAVLSTEQENHRGFVRFPQGAPTLYRHPQTQSSTKEGAKASTQAKCPLLPLSLSGLDFVTFKTGAVPLYSNSFQSPSWVQLVEFFGMSRRLKGQMWNRVLVSGFRTSLQVKHATNRDLLRRRKSPNKKWEH